VIRPVIGPILLEPHVNVLVLSVVTLSAYDYCKTSDTDEKSGWSLLGYQISVAEKAGKAPF
jgi:hypothetical protein